MEHSLQAVPDTKANRLNRLKHAWQELETRQAHGTVEHDTYRATIIAEAVEGELTQEEIGEVLGLKRAYISQLLLYHRFNVAVATLPKIPEGRFRQYWKEKGKGARLGRVSRDPVKQAERTRQEEEVFREIAGMVEHGIQPVPHHKAKQPGDPTAHAVASRQYKALIRKKLDAILSDLYTEVCQLEQLLKADHPLKYQPDFMISHSKRIQRALNTLGAFLVNERRWTALETDP
jgi:hypothetical protein